jgi:galactoside O-acetyltransferase
MQKGFDSFLSAKELASIGFKKYGNNIKISRKASIYSPQNITISDNVRIDDFCLLSAGDGIINIGSYVHIACYSALYGKSGIIIGDFCNISSRVAIYSESDDFSGKSLTSPLIPPKFKPGLIKGKVIIEKHCIVGTGCTIMPGVVLREGAAIGAHSFVSRTCSGWSVYFGVPAKFVKKRSREILNYEKEFLKNSHEC